MSVVPFKTQQHDQQNFNIITSSVAANKCIQYLVRKGYTVLSVKIEGAKPEIKIQHSYRCRHLKSVVMTRRNGRYGKENVHIATILNCKVRWTEKE